MQPLIKQLTSTKYANFCKLLTTAFLWGSKKGRLVLEIIYYSIFMKVRWLGWELNDGHWICSQMCCWLFYEASTYHNELYGMCSKNQMSLLIWTVWSEPSQATAGITGACSLHTCTSKWKRRLLTWNKCTCWNFPVFVQWNTTFLTSRLLSCTWSNLQRKRSTLNHKNMLHKEPFW